MKLRIAIQKSGRLNDDSLRLIKECGIIFSNGAGKLRAEADNFPLDILYLRDDDIPQYVADNVADIGIVGENVFLERNKQEADIIIRLGFSKCRLSIAFPKSKQFNNLQDLNGLNIATSYPVILDNFLRTNKINAKIHEISGSVEIAPSIGLADVICDLVSSGSTLLTNGLKEVYTVLKSEAILIVNNKLPIEKQHILNKLLFRINAVKRSRNNKYILLNAPDDKLEQIKKIIPGMKSPTIMPLADKGWSSVHSVVAEDKFWDIIEELKATGAEGILVIPIEKMID
ncbi:MAG: ATP phosphoribosyltransferase [Bacteroidales bacterium]|nr:ATP phosphoribosyltransferase [Bacteroidales bacterium]